MIALATRHAIKNRFRRIVGHCEFSLNFIGSFYVFTKDLVLCPTALVVFVSRFNLYVLQLPGR